MGTGDKMLGGNLRWTSIPSRGVAILLVGFMLQTPAVGARVRLYLYLTLLPEGIFRFKIV